MKPTKYRAIRSEADGIWFPSKKERDRYAALKLLERAGKITDLTLQPSFTLTVNAIKVATYRADFQYTTKTGEVIIEDVKGMKTPVYKLKKKMVEAQYGIKVTET
jgi:dsDNA-binding SOS-regulon protein